MFPLLLLHNVLPADTEGETAGKTIPFPVRLSFYVGAFAFLAAVLWTIFTTSTRRRTWRPSSG